MQVREALEKSYAVVKDAGYTVEELNPDNFVKYAPIVSYLVKQWPQAKRENTVWLKDWALTWRKMFDDFSEIYRRDPMIMYRPKNKAAEGFHRSNAPYRYYSGGNRSSKTTSGYAEHYFVLTGQHPFLDYGPPPHNTFIVSGLPFMQYDEPIFVKKMISGEGASPISPMFPTDGKWFYHYDSRKHILTVACPECAEAGKAQRCARSHRKSTLMLLSGENGVGVVEGFTAVLGHGDEHLQEEFFPAMKMRVADNPNGRLIFTGTPLNGLHAWEIEKLQHVAEGPAHLNLRDPGNPNSGRLVDYFTISQWDAGIVSHAKIRETMQGMDEFEIQARIMGQPAPLSSTPVFDVTSLRDMNGASRKPEVRCNIYKKGEFAWQQCLGANQIQLEEQATGPVRIWEKPQVGVNYLLCADSAAGILGRDASCCSVLKVSTMPDGDIRLSQVAQFHGWADIQEYAEKLFLLGAYYNYSSIVPETTGIGQAVLQALRNLGYWNIFARPGKAEEVEHGAASNLGIDTSPKTKPAMIAALQQLIKTRRIEIWCSDTIMELRAYEQIKTDSGTLKFGGAKGSHDDRVMALALGAHVILAYPMVDYMSGMKRPAQVQARYLDPVWGDVWKSGQQQNDREGDPFAWY